MAAHIKDLTGQRFGKLVVLRMLDERKNNIIMWECKCDCGNTVAVNRKYLSRGKNSASCGCSWKGSGINKDISNHRFGRLTAIKAIKLPKSGRIKWECVCDCGNTTYVTKDKLTSGNTTSCGCLRKEKLSIARASDITGQRFGKLQALHPIEERKHGHIVWECKCDCGNTTYALSSNLKCGFTLSCGCLQKDRVSKTNIKTLIGQRFGKLTVVADTEMRKNGYVVWMCQCDCGNTVYAPSRYLKAGLTTSCGCAK